jgi:hypothetical protein
MSLCNASYDHPSTRRTAQTVNKMLIPVNDAFGSVGAWTFPCHFVRVRTEPTTAKFFTAPPERGGLLKSLRKASGRSSGIFAFAELLRITEGVDIP